MKKTTNTLLVLCLLPLLLFSCTKDIISSDKQLLSITPEMLVSFMGKNWNAVSPQLENKKDYLYTTLNSGNTLAAISLPATDEQAPAQKYKIVINVNQQNIVSTLYLETKDSSNTETGNKLFLYYYDHAFSKLPGVYRKWATYNTQQSPPTTAEDLLQRLRSLNCQSPSLSFSAPSMVMSAGYRSSSGLFSFDMYAF
jgi:hypothetical protein